MDEKFLSRLNKNDILLCGHTHIPACENDGEHIYLNPGSVSIPKENSGRGYMTLCGGVFEWKTFGGEAFMSYSL